MMIYRFDNICFCTISYQTDTTDPQRRTAAVFKIYLLIASNKKFHKVLKEIFKISIILICEFLLPETYLNLVSIIKFTIADSNAGYLATIASANTVQIFLFREQI